MSLDDGTKLCRFIAIYGLLGITVAQDTYTVRVCVKHMDENFVL
jgi:hypothetical protein